MDAPEPELEAGRGAPAGERPAALLGARPLGFNKDLCPLWKMAYCVLWGVQKCGGEGACNSATGKCKCGL